MLRTTRPLLSVNRLGLAGRAPQVRHATLPLSASPSLPSHLLQSNQSARTAIPFVFRTSFSSKTPLQPTPREIKEREKELAQQPLEARPDEVSTVSSVRPLLESSQATRKSTDEDFLKGFKSDIHTFQEAFALSTVPKEPYALGLAGTLPYMGTSIATLYLSWNLNTTWPTSSNLLNSILVSHETASHWLHLLEPIQVGYGAVIISFLGAIHWGLEFAEKSASHNRTRFRYAIGVIAPAVAWPTVFMPVHWALTTQFLSFTFLYLADARATTWGWAPQWYGTYRWVLTAVVGAAIFISLVGRAKVGENRARLRQTDMEHLLQQSDPDDGKRHDWAKEEEQERMRLKKEEEKKKKEEERKKKEEEEKKKAEKGKKEKGEGKDGKEGKEDKPKKSEPEGDQAKRKGDNANKNVGQDMETGEGKRESEKGKKE
ncbi:hypothetical protein QBC34DRAFT_441620 [Podospora aff. communis PSN243]|uniref:Mitochondrial inner membrane protein 1 n=1 Tax=Podospora aff. communis PSN243 TaxID=3040156 RepID=A0AAV9GBX5_9PEZI|nr:hypothetical protein QBC34DRAFT_441620 [Podospora aff. communis PSN243]